MTQQRQPQAPQSDAELASLVASLIKDLRFGTLELTVHEGQLVQVERKEKYRFTPRRNG
ncbi:hypothetical protein A11A3_01000 [Alcanivorax hongdengensis A-11-3]|uniref:DUF2292 domain-containing protein n=1 Tax=Alcanivorax hongdengensis A-11-3 TaxID=1177179 RepID=L0WGP6_9GAMM|nr:YezD family protein [Alcanivorax hongdengensis]EKF76028.1 hypothetical protein A11A3_01000 [Alcanivorax hongdengensis A-11-3]